MAIADSIIQFFGIDLLSSASTFTDLLNVVMKIGVSLWVVIFIIRSMFLTASVAGRRFY